MDPRPVTAIATSAGLLPVDRLAVEEAIRGAHAESTWRTYRSAWRRFVRWCELRGYQALPADPVTVCAYLTWAAAATKPTTVAGGVRVVPTYKVSSFGVWLAAIGQAHEWAGHPNPVHDPAVKATAAGVRRARAGEPVRQAAPLVTDVLGRVLGQMVFDQWPHGLLAHRDAAMLLVGFAGAFRRSEVAGLNVGDVAATAGGVTVRLRHSKTNQDGSQRDVRALPFGRLPQTCPVCALVRWLDLADLIDNVTDTAALAGWVATSAPTRHVCDTPLPDRAGDPRPLFRRSINRGLGLPPVHPDEPDRWRLSGAGVHRVVQRRTEAAGLPAGQFSGHSLRAGFITEAFARDATPEQIRRQTGHKTDAILSVYNRQANPLKHNAVTVLGL